ncbi:uncharacterized protein [Rutidosis leptorrhynchoides]|uniref:uncharacterized protein n=1 Tax=Rutidosis leptorrhynchoides TaxID=125765 RepID=UPI003A99267D
MALVHTNVSKRTQFFSQAKILIHFSSAASPPFSSNETTISTAVSILKHHRSKSRWSELRTLFPSGFTPSQFSQITIQLRNNPHLALHFFQFTINHSLCQHSLLSYATIIHTLARSRQKSKALTLIQTAIRKFNDDENTKLASNSLPLIFETLIKTYRVCDSAPFVFDLLIKACIRSKRIDQASKIVRLLRTKGVSPLISTCNSLIMAVSKHYGSVAGYEVYNELFGVGVEFGGKKAKVIVPNIHTYNIIMQAFYNDALVEDVEIVWSDMIVNDCTPNEYSYSILMAVYCDNGRMDDAMRMWEEMQNSGLKHDVMAFNTIIGGFCDVGEVDRANEFFNGMRSGGIESSCVTYECLIKGYCKVCDVDSAMIVYKDMCRKGFVLVGCVVDLLIKVLCEKNGVGEALMVSRDVMKGDNAAINGESYVFLIKGLCDDGRMEEGMKLQAEMVGRGYEPNSEIYCAFINGYEKDGNIELAEKLKTELLGMQ